MTKRILLIRHGQTDWNTEGRWQGMMDVPLNATGVAQAKALAAYMKNEYKLDTLHSSDLQRASHTARLIGEAQGVAAAYDERLRELNIGILQGMTYQEMSEKYPTVVSHMRADYLGFVFPEGESRKMLQERAYAFWQDVIEPAGDQQIGIVTHGGVIRMLLLRLFENEIGIDSHGFSNTSVSVIEQEEVGWRLAQVGSTVHLSEDTHVRNEG